MASTHSYPACRNSEISEPCSLCCYIPRAALRVSYHGLCTGACGHIPPARICQVANLQHPVQPVSVNRQPFGNESWLRHGCVFSKLEEQILCPLQLQWHAANTIASVELVVRSMQSSMRGWVVAIRDRAQDPKVWLQSSPVCT